MEQTPIEIEVVYALPLLQTTCVVKSAGPVTIEEAIQQSGILIRHPEIDLAQNPVGIYSRVYPLSKRITESCRVEIYRSLIADPKEIRRQRAEKAKLRGQKG